MIERYLTLAVDFPPSSSIIRLTVGLLTLAFGSTFTGTTTSAVAVFATEGAICGGDSCIGNFVLDKENR
jgi:hypothetical protein